MLTLISCILLNILIGVLFKYFGKYDVNLLQAIVVNYFVCVLTASVCMGDARYLLDLPGQSWLIYAAIMGFMFFAIFYVIGQTVQSHGVMVAATSQKLSLIVPVIVAVIFFNENLTALKLIGVIAAICAVFFISYQKSDHTKVRSSLFVSLLPLLTWMGSSFVDLSLYLVEKLNLAPGAGMKFTSALFLFAGIFGSIYCLYLFIQKRLMLSGKSIFGGIIFGVPNFFSIYLILKLLEDGWPGSVVFPTMNVSIILLSALVGILIFKEQMSVRKAWGFGLAVLAIIFLSFQ